MGGRSLEFEQKGRGLVKPIGDTSLTRRKAMQWLAALSGRVLGARLFAVLGLSGGLASAGCAPDESENEAANPREPASPLHRAIRKHFDYLTIDDGVLDAFAADLLRNQGPWSSETSPRPYTRFLASTDFFQTGADESRPLRYVTYYDPYVSTCYNPFADSA